jgi:hypothetical protein
MIFLLPACGEKVGMRGAFARLERGTTPRQDRADHSALMLADRITLPHFSVSEARSLPNSAG